MRAALERRVMLLGASNGLRTWLTPVHLVGAWLAILVAAAIYFGDGSKDAPLVWIGGLAILVAAAASVAGSMRTLRMPAPTPLGTAVLALLAALVVWEGLSVFWSIEPDRSWNYFNRSLVYLAFVVLGLVAGTLRAAPRLAAAALAAAIGGAVVWALATKVFPGLSSSNERVARLSSPIGYWNALALLADLAIPLALWIAAPRSRPHWLRALGVVYLFAAGVALLLTFSRGGLAVGIVSLALWFALGRPRLESAAALAIALVPMLAVAGWAFSRPGLTKDGEPHSLQVHDGRWFALALVLGVATAFGGAYAASVTEERRAVTHELRRRLARFAAVAGAVVVAAGIVALLAAGITPSRVFHKFNEPVATSAATGPGRLGLASSSSRWSWWKESWQAWEEHPLQGTGAGTFDITHRRLRTDHTFATEPHNLPLQFLTETGIVGFIIFLGIAVAGAGALVESLLRLEGEDRLAATALTIGLAAYVVHGVVDFDWDFVGVTAPVFATFGVLVAAGRPARVRVPIRRTLLAVAAGALAAAALYSLASPWLATREVDDAYGAIGRGDPAAAVADAKSAHDLNPTAIDPLLVWAAAEHARGDDGEAGRLYTKAISLQPDNWRPWYFRARFLQTIDGPRAALFDAQQAASRDPLGIGGAYLAQLQKELGSASP